MYLKRRTSKYTWRGRKHNEKFEGVYVSKQSMNVMKGQMSKWKNTCDFLSTELISLTYKEVFSVYGDKHE